MKNLIIVAAGDESLHRLWGFGNFDIFIVYYGNETNRYRQSCKYYHQDKGTKFALVSKLVDNFKDLISEYDAIFIPDDDLYITSSILNKFFELFHSYKLELAQPSIIGWASIPLTLHQPNTLLRYTNWVEIMCPCFSRNAFLKCISTFNETKSNWGIERLWNKNLNTPKDKIAIIDTTIVIHTRPCFFGDTYYINGNTCESALKEQDALNVKFNLSTEFIEYSRIVLPDQMFFSLPSENRIYPNIDGFEEFCKSLRKPRCIL